MKIESVLIFLSLLFSLVWLLLKDIATSGMQWISLLKYIPFLLLYIRYFRFSFSSFLPVLFSLCLFLLVFFGLSADSYQGALVVAMVPICLYVFCHLTLSRPQVSFFQLLFFFAYLIYFLISFLYRERINPNQIGFTYLILAFNLFFCIYTNSNSKNVMTTLFIIGLLICTFILILLTKSRNSLLVFLLLPFAFLYRKKVSKLGIVMFAVLLLFFIYPWVYCQLAYNYDFRSSQNTELMNQDVFSGRQIIWSYVINELRNPSVFCFGGIDTEWWGKSLHNSAMDIIVRYGVPIMIILALIVLYYFRSICSLLNEKHQSLLILVLVTMIWGINESGIFLGYSFFLFLPYCFIKSQPK